MRIDLLSVLVEQLTASLPVTVSCSACCWRNPLNLFHAEEVSTAQGVRGD